MSDGTLLKEISERRPGYINRLTLLKWQSLAATDNLACKQWAGAATFLKERYDELLIKFALQNEWPPELFEAHLASMSTEMMAELEKLDPLHGIVNMDFVDR